jgi:amidase
MTTTQIDAFATANAMLRALRAREVSSVELLDLHVDRIQRLNPPINAIVTPDFARARAAAEAADATRARGEDRPLLGLPLTIKDCIDVAGLPTTAGVVERRDAQPAQDALLVQRVKDAGGVIIGKTNIPPMAGDWNADNPVFGRTNNPWNLERVPGGSTGGGAAALAAGLTPLEFGSDIGGSIRVPAAMCGVYGHRPSWTAIPSSGHFPGTPLPNVGETQGVQGPLARSAADLELAFSVVAGPDIGMDAWRLEAPPPRHERLADFSVALLPPIPWVPLDASVQFALENVEGALARAGVKLAPAQPEGFGDWMAHFDLYQKLLFTALTTGAPPEQRRQEADGQRITPVDMLLWLGERERFRQAFRDFFRRWDILLAPITPRPAYPHPNVALPMQERPFVVGGEPMRYDFQVVHPHLAILCGQPATAFPAGMSEEGLPVGLQAIGPFLEDRTTMRFVELLTAEVGGFRRPPGYE